MFLKIQNTCFLTLFQNTLFLKIHNFKFRKFFRDICQNLGVCYLISKTVRAYVKLISVVSTKFLHFFLYVWTDNSKDNGVFDLPWLLPLRFPLLIRYRDFFFARGGARKCSRCFPGHSDLSYFASFLLSLTAKLQKLRQKYFF